MISGLKRRIAVFAAALMVLFVAGAVAATPAHAAYSDCFSWCAWVDSNGNGSRWDIPGIVNSCQSVPAGWNDVISSAYNTGSSWKLVFYSEAGCWGIAKTFWPGGSGNMTGMNDAASSWKLMS